MTIPTQEIRLSVLEKYNIELYLRREDLIHPMLSGNKFRKLKYNVSRAKQLKHHTLITFGGAFSNHIPAAAFAAKEQGLKSLGIIRGEELQATWKENPTLAMASELGMKLLFVTREVYRQRDNKVFLEEVSRSHGPAYLIPEGGTNELGVIGCEEIIRPQDREFDYICCAVGTGGTIAGISRAAFPHQKVLGFPALKGEFLKEDIRKFAANENWELCSSYHFGGYARVSGELVAFINDFRERTGVPLDPVYTGKMMFGILDMISKGEFRGGSSILAIHTGGLQGIEGMNGVLKKKKLPLLTI